MFSRKIIYITGLTISFLFIAHPSESAEDSLYDFLWLDPDKSVYVLQNKTYKKKNTFFLEANVLRIIGNEFLNTWGGVIKGGYYFSEQWGVSISYNHYANEFSDNFTNVKRVSSVEPFLRRLNSAITAELLWTPFYGKVNTFNRIYYFDWGFGVGLSSIQADSNLNSVFNENTPTSFSDETITGFVYKTDFRIYLNQNYYFNIELRNTTYSAGTNPNDKSSKELQTNTDLLFGIGKKF